MKTGPQPFPHHLARQGALHQDVETTDGLRLHPNRSLTHVCGQKRRSVLRIRLSREGSEGRSCRSCFQSMACEAQMYVLRLSVHLLGLTLLS